jgi:hypothetical protein
MSRLIDLPDSLMHDINDHGDIESEVLRLIKVYQIANDLDFSDFSINEILIRCQKLIRR